MTSAQLIVVSHPQSNVTRGAIWLDARPNGWTGGQITDKVLTNANSKRRFRQEHASYMSAISIWHTFLARSGRLR